MWQTKTIDKRPKARPGWGGGRLGYGTSLNRRRGAFLPRLPHYPAGAAAESAYFSHMCEPARKTKRKARKEKRKKRGNKI